MIDMTIAAVVRLVTGATVEWRCDPVAGRQRIYFANHTSHLDFAVIWSALPPRIRRFVRPVAGRDYWQRGVRQYLAERVFNAVLIDRRSPDGFSCPHAATRTIEHMALEMGQRYSLIVFPEGTRSISGDVQPFRSGLYHLARRRPDAELIPVHLENLSRILPKGETLPVPMVSRLIFGSALSAATSTSKDEFLRAARTALIDLGVAS